MRITENDIDTRPVDHDSTLTAEQWWAEFYSNACCSSRAVAARWDCGCGGSAEVPMTISRLLMKGHDEEVF